MSGFISGAASLRTTPEGSRRQGNVTASPQATPLKITIAYGTETGNAKSLAGKLSAIAKGNGIVTKSVALDQYKPEALSKEQYLVVVISTQGDGEPPAAAQKFYEHLNLTTTRLPDLQFGVIGLGDSSYPLFCQTGKDVDLRLEQLGGTRVRAAQLCDTDYEDAASAWFGSFVESLRGAARNEEAVTPVSVQTAVTSQRKTYTGIVKRNVNLNDRGSEKCTHHIELSAEGVDYQPGDALGIIPQNSPALVSAILDLSGGDSAQLLDYRGVSVNVEELLRHRVNISFLPARLVKKYAGIVSQEVPEVPLGLYDLLRIYPVKDAAQFGEVLQMLDPIAPRLYSIASSPAAHDSELHVTVKRDEFCTAEEQKCGLCSDYLTTLPADSRISFYIHPNNRFRLPSPDADIIMIGAGTGIAPFRSFVAERGETGAVGRNWLFFGDQRFTSDFLYQTEWQGFQESGVLTRINTAFSRDQAEKVYVQHKLKANAAEVFEWLENGASIYVCGARQPMSVDVENALLEIISEQGARSRPDAETYLQELVDSGRYLKDVY